MVASLQDIITYWLVGSLVKETLLNETFCCCDVGLILKQLLTRADDFFGSPFVLTLTEELTQRGLRKFGQCDKW
jgi:hypothetical protein